LERANFEMSVSLRYHAVAAISFRTALHRDQYGQPCCALACD
jgi:hypothetical protein